MTDRRHFLKHSSLLAASLALPNLPTLAQASTAPASDDRWEALRQEFELDYSYAHFCGFLLASPPRTVRNEIARHRTTLARMPSPEVYYEQVWKHEANVRQWAARYLQVTPAQIALTGSTTQGLSLVYGGIHLKPGQEILSTTREHMASHDSLALRERRDGVKVRKIPLFQNPSQVTKDEILGNLDRAINANTRVVGMTWVHSGSGVKLPIGEIGSLISQHNKERDEQQRILFCVDGVHGFGVEDVNFADLNCDFFIAGTHKWLFGPHGTGIICSASAELQHISPLLASFSGYEDFGRAMTPGGFHAFENQWATDKAFALHLQLGKANVQQRIHQLNDYLKQRLDELPGLELVTPRSTELSAGFTFFRLRGHDPDDIEAYLAQQRILVDATERDSGPVLRMAPGLINNEAEIDRTVEQLKKRLINRT